MASLVESGALRVLRIAADGTLQEGPEDPPAPPSTPATGSQLVTATEDEPSPPTPPLPRGKTSHLLTFEPIRHCGGCDTLLAGLPCKCLECGIKLVFWCVDCIDTSKPTLVRCHYASRHTNDDGYLCVGCALVCDRCEVDVCADCGRTCSICEDFVCWGCAEVDDPARLGDVCPKCEAAKGKKQRTEQAAMAAESVPVRVGDWVTINRDVYQDAYYQVIQISSTYGCGGLEVLVRSMYDDRHQQWESIGDVVRSSITQEERQRLVETWIDKHRE